MTSSDFETSYSCMLDPELPASGGFPQLYSFRTPAQDPHVLRVSSNASGDWFAEIGASELERDGLTGVFSTPSPRHAVVVVNGRGYYVDASRPGAITPLRIEPIKEVKAVPSQNTLLVISPWEVAGIGRGGHLWTTERLAADGIRFRGMAGDRAVLEVDMGDELQEVYLAVDTGHALRSLAP